MAKKPRKITAGQDGLDDVIPSPFDRREPDEAELWFLPGPAEQADDPGLSRTGQNLFDPADWVRAQGALSGDLAGLALLFGALDERLAHLGPELGAGACQRLALRESADLSWWAAGRVGGARIGVERLSLWVGGHLGGGLDDSLALAQAGWAMRRLTAGQGPEAGPDGGGWQAGITAFLGHIRDNSLADAADLATVMEAARALHPVTRSAMLFHAWRVVRHGAVAGAVGGAATDIEAAVMAAVHAATMAPGNGDRTGGHRTGGHRTGGHRTGGRRAGASFMPLALSGLAGLQAAGPAKARLAAWIGGAENSCLAAMALLDRLAAWRAAAEHDLIDQTGRTPAMLVALLADWPMVSGPMAAAQTGASRAAVQRNLDRLAARGLIREITGQGRYRVWTAKL